MQGTQGLEAQLGHIVDELPGLVWTVLPDGNIDFLNRRWLEYTGLSLEEACGTGWQSIIHPEDLPALLKGLGSIRTTGEPHEIEARIRSADGEYRWFLFRYSPLAAAAGASGQTVKWCGIGTDIDDRKRSEESLRESEQQFRSIFDEAGAGITLLDLKSNAIRNNRAMKTMLNCSDEELRTVEMFTALTTEKNRDLDLELFVELRHGKLEQLRQEKHFILKDGRSVWANVIFTLLRDPAGAPRYVISIHEDITERKLALQKLQANQELLDLAQKAARAMAFDWHIQKDVNTWSPEQEALYGLEPGTFDGTYESWKNLVHPADWALIVEAIKNAHETGDISAEYRVVWPDGSTHWLSANGQMFFDDQDRPFRMVGFTADITRRKLVEEELRRSEAFLAEGQRLSLTGSFSWRPDTDEVIFSDESRRIFDFGTDEEVTMKLIGARIHPEDFPATTERIGNARTGHGDQDFENRLQMPDGSVKHIHTIAHGIQHNDGRLEYIGAVQDVTERRLSEEALGKARSELAHVARVTALGALTASIAHEVNQPLSGIITNASTCLRMLAADPPNVAGALETARRTIRDGHRASDVITRLRALFSKGDIAPELVDLNEAAREVIALSQSELQRGQVLLRTELANDLPRITGDRVQLQQVILNLLLNASDAMSAVEDRPRHLLVRTASDKGERVLLTVQDSGTGLETENMNKLFEAFYTTKKTGMGIGLSVSRSIIESHQGTLWVEPNNGPGAAFSFSIPCVSEKQALRSSS